MKLSNTSHKRLAELVILLTHEMHMAEMLPRVLAAEVTSKNDMILYYVFLMSKICGIQEALLDQLREYDPNLCASYAKTIVNYEAFNDEEVAAEIRGEKASAAEAKEALDRIFKM